MHCIPKRPSLLPMLVVAALEKSKVARKRQWQWSQQWRRPQRAAQLLVIICAPMAWQRLAIRLRTMRDRFMPLLARRLWVESRKRIRIALQLRPVVLALLALALMACGQARARRVHETASSRLERSRLAAAPRQARVSRISISRTTSRLLSCAARACALPRRQLPSSGAVGCKPWLVGARSLRCGWRATQLPGVLTTGLSTSAWRPAARRL